MSIPDHSDFHHGLLDGARWIAAAMLDALFDAQPVGGPESELHPTGHAYQPSKSLQNTAAVAVIVGAVISAKSGRLLGKTARLLEHLSDRDSQIRGAGGCR